MILPKALDTIIEMNGDFKILKLDVGKTKKDESYFDTHPAKAG